MSPVEKIEQYEQCYSKIIEMDINDIYEFPDPNYFQRMVYRGPEVPRIFEKKRRALSVRPRSPTPGPSTAPDVLPGPSAVPDVVPDLTEATEPNREYENEEQDIPDFSDSNDVDKSLLRRFACRAEILSIQLDNVLGRPVPSGPLLYDHERSKKEDFKFATNISQILWMLEKNKFPS